MAAEFVGGAALGALFGEAFTSLHEGIKRWGNKSFNYNSTLKSLTSNLDRLAPAVEKIRKLSVELDRQEDLTKSLIDQMNKAAELIHKCSRFNGWKRFLNRLNTKYLDELTKLDKEIVRFIQVDMLVHIGTDVLQLEKRMSSLEDKKSPVLSCLVPTPPEFIVGWKVPLEELKSMLSKEESLLVLTAPGGCGKTTLATMLCQDEDIKRKFKGNIFFVPISKTPNLKNSIRRLFQHVNEQVPDFQSDEDAVNHLQELKKKIGSNPTLLILDDVWRGSKHILDKFKFHMSNCKILVTSRTSFRSFSTYNLEPLNPEDAMALFHHSASLKRGSSCIPDEDIKKMLKGCGRFPLAIEVIGGSLCGQPAAVQLSRVRKWSSNHFSFNSNLLNCLRRSLEFSDDELILKECFMDLGSFPEDQTIPVAALIEMWAELYELSEDGIDAIANLYELTFQNLASLVTNKDVRESINYYNEGFVTQHDLLRELAIHESNQGPIGERKRLILNISGNTPPSLSPEQKQQLINARLFSISTDELFSSSWCDIQAPNVEVLVLNFQSKIYSLPEFVDKMDKLKVVIITNYGFFHAELINFQLLKSLSNLKRIRLEKVSVPSLFKAPVWLRSLKKLSLFMCNFGVAFGNSTMKVKDALPNLMEINIDYCNDLVELPAWLCDFILLKTLSISNCHHLSGLPEGIGMLVNLEVLGLRSCTELSKLPDSIKGLQKLRILDISDCLGIRNLPNDIGELCDLKELHMKGYLNFNFRNELPQSTMKLKQLKLVICDDEERAKLWEPFKEVLPSLEVRIVKKEISLNWLNLY